MLLLNLISAAVNFLGTISNVSSNINVPASVISKNVEVQDGDAENAIVRVGCAITSAVVGGVLTPVTGGLSAGVAGLTAELGCEYGTESSQSSTETITNTSSSQSGYNYQDGYSHSSATAPGCSNMAGYGC